MTRTSSVSPTCCRLAKARPCPKPQSGTFPPWRCGLNRRRRRAPRRWFPLPLPATTFLSCKRAVLSPASPWPRPVPSTGSVPPAHYLPGAWNLGGNEAERACILSTGMHPRCRAVAVGPAKSLGRQLDVASPVQLQRETWRYRRTCWPRRRCVRSCAVPRDELQTWLSPSVGSGPVGGHCGNRRAVGHGCGKTRAPKEL